MMETSHWPIPTTPCEGRCSVLLDADMLEIGAAFFDSEHPYGPQHSPARCRIARLYRDTTAAAIPGWEVKVAPFREDLLIVLAYSEQYGPLLAASHVVVDYGPTDILEDLAAGCAVRIKEKIDGHARALHRSVSTSAVDVNPGST